MALRRRVRGLEESDRDAQGWNVSCRKAVAGLVLKL